MSTREQSLRHDPALARRTAIIRRETTSSRAPAVIFSALLVSVLCSYFMFEALLKALGQEPWIRSWEQWWVFFAGLPAGMEPAVLALGGVLVLLAGLLLLLQGILPGRQAKYLLPDGRAVIIVDARVLAASLARRARVAAGVTPDQVLVTVGRRMVQVRLRPTSGIPVDPQSVEQAVREELRRTAVDPMPEVRVEIAASGVIGQ